MSGTMRVRRAVPADAAVMVDINARAIRLSTADLYTAEQLEAWAGGLTVERRRQTVAQTIAYVAVVSERVIGFCNLVADAAEIDLLYVDPAFGGRGAARALVAIVERAAAGQQLSELHTHASLRAEPVFERLGYRVVRREQHHHNGHVFARVHMAKTLR